GALRRFRDGQGARPQRAHAAHRPGAGQSPRCRAHRGRAFGPPLHGYAARGADRPARRDDLGTGSGDGPQPHGVLGNAVSAAASDGSRTAMTLVQVMPQDDRQQVLLRTTDRDEIAEVLAPYGIRLEQWPLRELPAEATKEQLLAAYEDEVAAVCARGGYRLVDVVRMTPQPQDPQWRAGAETARRRFLDEHRHAEDEVRFFAEGSGCFYLHL